jgi:hypothetical protein
MPPLNQGGWFLIVGLFFVWRSFYGMRISYQTVKEEAASKRVPAKA